MTTGYDRLYEALDERGLITSHSSGGNVYARCPSHRDGLPSLSISEGDNGFPLAYCHAGCSWHDIVEALGLQDLNGRDESERHVVAQYVYVDEAGEPLFRVNRTEPKGFFQERSTAMGWALGLKDTRRVLYNLPAVLGAVENDLPIWIMEGEKDVETFQATQTGAVATCYVGGAGKWDAKAYGALGSAARVYAVADCDAAGRKQAALLTEHLPQLHVLWPREGKDFTDHVYSGWGLDDLLPHEPVETDWDDWDETVPDFDWLVPGIFARGTLVWAYGPKESAKSMYLLDICSRLSHQGVTCAYYSEEMARTQDKRRISRFGPNRDYFHWKNGRGLNLADEEQLGRVIAENHGTAFLVLDSYERIWDPPYSNENKRAVGFARAAHAITVETGATVVVIDHTGFGFRDQHGNIHEERKPRGASAKEQQADMSILFTSLGRWKRGQPYRFRIENMKPGRLENPFVQELEVVDTPNGGLAVVRSGLGLAPYESEATEGADDELRTARPGSSAPSVASTPEQQKRIRQLLRKGKSREDAYNILAIEEAFGATPPA